MELKEAVAPAELCTALAKEAKVVIALAEPNPGAVVRFDNSVAVAVTASPVFTVVPDVKFCALTVNETVEAVVPFLVTLELKVKLIPLGKEEEKLVPFVIAALVSERPGSSLAVDMFKLVVKLAM